MEINRLIYLWSTRSDMVNYTIVIEIIIEKKKITM